MIRTISFAGPLLACLFLLVKSQQASELDHSAVPISTEPNDVDSTSDASDTGVTESADQEPSNATRDGEFNEIAPSEHDLPPLSPEMIALRDRIRRCLEFYFTRNLNSRDHSVWSIMHAFIGFGVDTQIDVGGPGGKRVNAISWLCGNRPCRGVRLLYSINGQLRASVGPGLQGHDGQFLAMLAQSRVKMDYPLIVDGKQFTVADLVELEKSTCRPYSELTFKLIGLVHYLDIEATWKNDRGTDWDLPRLIKHELAQPINGATCGGTHRMMGFSYAVRKRERRGQPVNGQWRRAQKFVQDYHTYTFRLQNPDGSFSTNYFRGRANRADTERRLETTGHILEWLVFSLPKEELREPKTVLAVQYLTELLDENRYRTWPDGPRGHALHALALYSERVFGDLPGQRRMQLARANRGQRSQ